MPSHTFYPAQALADEFKVRFFETSAKNNTNVDEVFQSIARDIMARQRDAAPDNSGGGQAATLRVGGSTPQRKQAKSGCC